jgi:hypothetical protein
MGEEFYSEILIKESRRKPRYKYLDNEPKYAINRIADESVNSGQDAESSDAI